MSCFSYSTFFILLLRSLYAVDSTAGRFGIKEGEDGLYVDWALDGEVLFKGDQIIECNGVKSKEGIQNLIDSTGRCQLVVVRKKNSEQNNPILLQSQQDNQRLQHRISYLEDQVRDLINQNCSRSNQKVMNRDHVTSINISSDPQVDNEDTQVFQRGNFIATIIGGKAIQTNSHSISTNGTPTHNYRNSIQQQFIGTNSKIIDTRKNLKDKHIRDHRDLLYEKVCLNIQIT